MNTNERDALMALVAKWHKEADEIAANNWACNSYSIRARADELEQVLAAQPAEGDVYLRAVDQGRVIAHIGTAEPTDDYATAERKLAELIDWHVAVATDPAVNGGFKLMSVNSAGGAKGDMTECGHSKYDPCHNCEPVNTPQLAEDDGAVAPSTDWPAVIKGEDGHEYVPRRVAEQRVWGALKFSEANRPSAAAAVPEGFVLVPRIMHLDADTLQAASFIFGGGDGEFWDTVFSVGITTDDDGKETYGLFCYSADFPGEGTIPLFGFAAPAALAQQETE